MDNIIEFLNFEDEGLEVLDQKVENGRRILTLQKKPGAHFCPVCSYRMHSKGITPRTINHPVMQDGLQRNGTESNSLSATYTGRI